MIRNVTIVAILAIVAAIIIGSSGDGLVDDRVQVVAPAADAPTALYFDRNANGHFIVEALVDGQQIPFMVDTGASLVVLSPADAERLGLRLEPEDYTWTYQSANGVGRAAPIRLRAISIGGLQGYDVEAAVINSDMTFSLLGQSFLRKLSGFEVSGNQLVLHP